MARHECISDADLNRLWEGDTPESERKALERHIDICPGCGKRWEEFAGGMEHIEESFSKGGPLAKDCPDNETLGAFVDGLLASEDMEQVRDHIGNCSACNQTVLEARYLEARWRDEHSPGIKGRFVEGVLTTLSMLPDAKERIRGWLKPGKRAPLVFREDVRLRCFEPRVLAAKRLAAGTGEGFERQRMGDAESPLTVELVQFGREARVVVEANPNLSQLSNCLVEVSFTEDDRVKLSRVVLVRGGRGQCVLSPEEVDGMRPEEKAFRITAEPVLTLDELERHETAATLEILGDLVTHPDAEIRKLSVETLAGTGNRGALKGIRLAKDDGDPSVRDAAARAERNLLRELGDGKTGEV